MLRQIEMRCSKTIARYDPYYMTQNLASLQPTCTSLDALGPCVIELHVADISAFLKPSTTTSAAAAFTDFLDCATLATCGTGDC